MRVLLCESCGAPMDAPWDQLVVVCRHCGADNLPGRPGDPVPLRAPVDGRPRVNLGGRTWVLESRLADGDSSAVYRARWVVRLGELAVLKVLRAPADADRLRSEWHTLQRLAASTVDGASHFVSRLPAPIAHGLVDTDRPRTASLFGWKSGFVHTLHDIGEAHPEGVRAEVVVWLLKRLLELLGFVHRSGFVHGAVTPDHVLVHPQDHGATLIGWTCAVPWSASREPRPLPARPAAWRPLYAGHTLATPALDVAMACRCVRAVAGWQLPEAVLRPRLQAVIDRGAAGDWGDAWALRDQLVLASADELGPPAHHPLPMPGWRH